MRRVAAAALILPSLSAAIPPVTEGFRLYYNLQYDSALAWFE
jgi:hypothetical protein